jgi:hypothetical protein
MSTAETMRERKLHRAYMRRWRSRPGNRRRELDRQRRVRMAGKINDARKMGPKLCGYCNARRAVRVVTRLEILESAESEGSRSGFIEVRVPYCGVC